MGHKTAVMSKDAYLDDLTWMKEMSCCIGLIGVSLYLILVRYTSGSWLDLGFHLACIWWGWKGIWGMLKV